MDPSITYALVIGVNEYECPEYPKLQAAVGDANLMEYFFRTTLRIPDGHIVSIRDAQASREGILAAFKKLEDISGVSEEPCILIFYAGHGSRTEKPSEWKDWAMDSSHVEMLCPSDMGMSGKGGQLVEGIPDRTVCYLLNQLSKLRGNNITLILDCCCSGGLNRGGDVPMTARQILRPPPLSGKADPQVHIEEPSPDIAPVASTRGMRLSPGFGGKFQDSHMLLAACGRDSVAYEFNGHGLFTSVLLQLLPQVNLQTTTYASLMTKLKMPKWQTPHCEGTNFDRPLFNRRGDRSDPSYIHSTRIKDDSGKIVVTLDAGVAQGITLGELFSIHNNNLFQAGTANPSIGTLCATAVRTSSSLLDHPPGYPRFKIPRSFYTKRIDWTNDPPKIFCKNEAWLDFVFPPNKRQIKVVEDRSKASLVLTVEERKVRLSLTDPFLLEHVPERFPHEFDTNKPEDVRTIVGAWQHFNYHLHRRGKNQFRNVRMEMHYLEPISLEGYEWFEAENYRTTGENLLEQEPSEIVLSDPDGDKPVGITLYNDGDTPLYPYLFYFDPNNLTITPWFTAPHGAGLGNVDAPLGPHSKLPIGYGNGAASPWQFCLDEGRSSDVGFFKLFLSVSPTNFSSLAQDQSPFDRLGLSKTRGAAQSQPAEEEALDADSWGVKVATTLQFRGCRGCGAKGVEHKH